MIRSLRLFLIKFGATSSLTVIAMVFAHAQAMPKVDLSLGMYRIEAEVAADTPSRMQGLMNRRAMPQQSGMLFVFEQPQMQCMWMKNTLLPLSVAFIDEQGKIINIADMQPQTETSHCAERPALYALEMNQGWFKSKGIGPGVKLKGLNKPQPAR